MEPLTVVVEGQQVHPWTFSKVKEGIARKEGREVRDI